MGSPREARTVSSRGRCAPSARTTRKRAKAQQALQQPQRMRVRSRCRRQYIEPVSEDCLRLFVPPADDDAPRSSDGKAEKGTPRRVRLPFLHQRCSLPIHLSAGARLQTPGGTQNGDLEPVWNEENTSRKQIYALVPTESLTPYSTPATTLRAAQAGNAFNPTPSASSPRLGDRPGSRWKSKENFREYALHNRSPAHCSPSSFLRLCSSRRNRGSPVVKCTTCRRAVLVVQCVRGRAAPL